LPKLSKPERQNPRLPGKTADCHDRQIRGGTLIDDTRYPAHVFWSDEDGGYIAIAPDLPGCSAFGATQQEALTELQDATAAWIDASRAAGNPIPPPSRPAEESAYSGKVLVRMPKRLHAQLAKQAKKDDVSLNQYIVFLLTSASTQRAFQSLVYHQYDQSWLRVLTQSTAKSQSLNKFLIVKNLMKEETGFGLLRQDGLRYIADAKETRYG
jgi:predicted RNase H-like HicB family nuclease